MDQKQVNNESNVFLKLNISGKKVIMKKTTALRFQDSLFAELANLEEYGNSDKTKSSEIKLSKAAASSFFMVDKNEFYLERSTAVFDLVLHYVYTGRLHCPASVCKEMLMEEMGFWRVDQQEAKIAKCCQKAVEEKNELDAQKSVEEPVDIESEPPKTFFGKVWLCCEKPSSSSLASTYNLVSMFFIVLSVVNLVLSSVKSLHHCHNLLPPDAINLTSGQNSTQPNITQDQPIQRCEGGIVFDAVEAVCIGWFTLELIVRFIACPDKCRFFKSSFNIIDIIATLPFYIELILKASNLNKNELLMVYAFRLLRLSRVFRALRLARHLDSIRIMGETLNKCRKDLSILGVFIFMAMIVSSSMIYYFERDEPKTQFTSIPASFWWCIVTLTTVGYGDMVPATSGGRTVAGFSCVVGIILLAMPISIMVDQFKSHVDKKRSVEPKRGNAFKFFGS